MSAKSTVVCVVAVLLAGSASVSLSVAVAVLVSVLVGGAVKTMVTVALAPPFSVPMLQIIGRVPVHIPAVEFADMSGAPAGRVSVSVTPVAGISPLFLTVIV